MTSFDRLSQEMVAGFALLQPTADPSGLPLDFIIRSVNAAFAHLTGLSAAEMIGQPLSKILPESHSAWFPHLFSTTTAEDKAPHFQFYDKQLDRHLNATAFRIDRHHIVLTCQNTSDQRSVEADMRTTAIEILTGGIAHDFNSLLAQIKENVSQAISQLEPKETRTADCLKEAFSEAKNAQKLARHLAALIRKGTPLKESAAVAQIVRKTATFCTRRSAVRCVFDLPKGLWTARIGAISLSQAVQGIVMRAVQTMPGGGTITLHAENLTIPPDTELPIRPGHYIRITSTDTGPAIDPRELPRIFTPPFPDENVPARLGLSASFSIARHHGGHITASSRPDSGTCMEMVLPAHAKASGTHTNRPLATIARQSGRILVMDDEAAMRHLLTHVLTRLGFETAQASNGAEAVDLYRQGIESGRPFAAILLDLIIPNGMNGKETLDQIVKLDPAVKAVVCSGFASSPFITHYREHGFAAALPKPFTIHTLAKTMSQLLPSVPDPDPHKPPRVP